MAKCSKENQGFELKTDPRLYAETVFFEKDGLDWLKREVADKAQITFGDEMVIMDKAFDHTGLIGFGAFVTEICGVFGSGATNLCLKLAINTARQNAKVVYMKTGGRISRDRFRDLAPDMNNLLNQIFFVNILNFNDLVRAIVKMNAFIRRKGHVRLIVVDVVSHAMKLAPKVDMPFHCVRMVSALQELSYKHDISVILVNQLAKKFFTGEEPVTAPSLGRTFLHKMTASMRLYNVDRGHQVMNFTKTLFTQPSTIDFEIGANSITDREDDESDGNYVKKEEVDDMT